MAHRFLVVDAYDRAGREALHAAGCTEAGAGLPLAFTSAASIRRLMSARTFTGCSRLLHPPSIGGDDVFSLNALVAFGNLEIYRLTVA